MIVKYLAKINTKLHIENDNLKTSHTIRRMSQLMCLICFKK